MMKYIKHVTPVILSLVTFASLGQSRWHSTVQEFLNENFDELGLTAQDVASFTVTDKVYTRKTGVWHVHVAQTVNQLPVINGVANVTIGPDGKVVAIASRLVAHVQRKATGPTGPSIAPLGAIQKAKEILGTGGQHGNALTPTADGNPPIRRGDAFSGRDHA